MAQSNHLIKIANTKIDYNQEKLRQWIACKHDPLYFMENFMWIRHPDPTRGRIRFEAYPFQKNMVTTFWNHKDSIALLPRQSGKCVTSDVNVVLRNKKTNKIYGLPVGIYYEWIRCARDGQIPPDISYYERRN